jgi:peptide/nickel transport system ATP-binding protein
VCWISATKYEQDKFLCASAVSLVFSVVKRTDEINRFLNTEYTEFTEKNTELVTLIKNLKNNLNPLLEIKNLCVDFVSEYETTAAVKDLSLSVKRGELVAIVGESGSGKSVTSLSILQLIPSPPAKFSGEINLLLENETINLLNTTESKMQQLRGNRIAMIFQEPMTSLNPVMTCGKQVLEALLQHKQISAAIAKQKVINWFEKVKLPDPAGMFNRYPHQLSGGQKQRVMIALAMCCDPDLLICDEPTTALDVTVQKTILELIRELKTEQNIGVIFITHDLAVVSEIADRVAIMYQGALIEENSRDAIFSAPQHPYTKALLACRPALHPKGERLPVVADFLEVKNENKSIEKKLFPVENNIIVDVRNLMVRFPVRTNMFGKTTKWFEAVKDVSFQVKKGETLGVVGESGCGKTTLGRTILRLVEPASGKIMINGQDVAFISGSGAKQLRREVQLVFQDPYSSLNPRLTIGDAIEEPMHVFGLHHSKERKKKVQALLDQVGLPSAYYRRYPHEFSGGQRQRIVIARALALAPELLVCDESVSALDVSVQAQVLNLLNDLKNELGLTMIFISHDLSVVRYMSDRIAVMQAGMIVEIGESEKIYTDPQSSYTKELLRAIPKIAG